MWHQRLLIYTQMKLRSERDTTPQKTTGYENVDLKASTSTDNDYSHESSGDYPKQPVAREGGWRRKASAL